LRNDEEVPLICPTSQVAFRALLLLCMGLSMFSESRNFAITATVHETLAQLSVQSSAQR
jgi:hypothetical protein